MRLDLSALLGGREEQPVTAQLVHGVVAGGAREDEDDDRQEVVALERLHQFASAAASERAAAARSTSGPCHLGPGAKAPRGLHQVVDAPGLVREARSVEEVVDLGVGLATPHRPPRGCGAGWGACVSTMIAVGPRTSANHSPRNVGVADGRREGDEAHGRRGEDEHLLPDPTAEGVLEEVDLVEHDEAQGRRAGRTR